MIVVKRRTTKGWRRREKCRRRRRHQQSFLSQEATCKDVHTIKLKQNAAYRRKSRASNFEPHSR